MMKKYLWVKIDIDSETEDILAVADSQRELAKMCGVKEKSIRETMSRAKRLGMKCCYIKIEDPEE